MFFLLLVLPFLFALGTVGVFVALFGKILTKITTFIALALTKPAIFFVQMYLDSDKSKKKNRRVRRKVKK